jgi:hypothetical protein
MLEVIVVSTCAIPGGSLPLLAAVTRFEWRLSSKESEAFSLPRNPGDAATRM